MNSRDEQNKQLQEIRRRRQDEFERKQIEEENQRKAANHLARQRMFEARYAALLESLSTGILDNKLMGRAAITDSDKAEDFNGRLRADSSDIYFVSEVQKQLEALQKLLGDILALSAEEELKIHLQLKLSTRCQLIAEDIPFLLNLVSKYNEPVDNYTHVFNRYKEIYLANAKFIRRLNLLFHPITTSLCDELRWKFADINLSQINFNVEVENNEPDILDEPIQQNIDVDEYEAQDTNVFDPNSLLGLPPEMRAHILTIGMNEAKSAYQLFNFVTRVSHINKHFRQLMESKHWTDEILNKLETFVGKGKVHSEYFALFTESIKKDNFTSFKYLLKIREKLDLMVFIPHIMFYQRHEMLSLVLKAGLNPNHEDYYFKLSIEPILDREKFKWRRDKYYHNYVETPLHFARDVKSIEILVDKGAVVSKSYAGITLLHYAGKFGRIEIIDKLITDFKLNPNARDHKGRTPLHYAVCCGNLSVLKKLIEWSADPAKTDKHGLSVFDYANRMGKKNIIQFLSEQGYDPHRKIYNEYGDEITAPIEILMNEFEYVISGHKTIKTLLTAVNKFAAMDRDHREVTQHPWMQIKLEKEAKKLLSSETLLTFNQRDVLISKLSFGLAHSIRACSTIVSVLFTILSEYLEQRRRILEIRKNILPEKSTPREEAIRTEKLQDDVDGLYFSAIDTNSILVIQKIKALDGRVFQPEGYKVRNKILLYALQSKCAHEVFISLLNIYKEQHQKFVSENKLNKNPAMLDMHHSIHKSNIRELLFEAAYKSKFEIVKLLLATFPTFLNIYFAYDNKAKNSILAALRRKGITLEPWLIKLIHQSPESEKEGIIGYALQYDAELLIHLLKSNEIKTDSHSIYHYLLTCMVEGGNFEVLLNDKSIEQVLVQRDSHFHVQRLIALAILYDKPSVSQKLYELIENHHLEDDFLFGEHIRPEFLLCAALELNDDKCVEDLLNKTKAFEPKYFDQYPQLFNDWKGYVSYQPIHIALCSKKMWSSYFLWIIASYPACDILQITPRMLTQVYEKNYFYNIIFLIQKAASAGRINLLTHFLHIAAQAGLVETNAVLSVLNRNTPLTRLQFDELLSSQDRNGNTMLHLAIQCEQLEVVCRLTNSKLVKSNDWPTLKQPSIDIENNNGVTPLMIALMKGPAYFAALLGTVKDKQSMEHHIAFLEKQMSNHLRMMKPIIKNKLLALNLENERTLLSKCLPRISASRLHYLQKSIFESLIKGLNQNLIGDAEKLCTNALLEWRWEHYANPFTLLSKHSEYGVSTFFKPTLFNTLQKYLGKAMLKRIHAVLENTFQIKQRPGQPG